MKAWAPIDIAFILLILISGNFTEAWLSSSPDRRAIADRVSPLSYVRTSLPPILSIHGGFNYQQVSGIYAEIRDFLQQHDVGR
jgi:hypothetical protein